MSAPPARLRSAWVLAAALAALWIAQLRPFVFPNNDFYSFRRAAWSFSRGELPQSTKRGPILPAAIAVLAPAIPGEQPELGAALAVNLACSLALFVVLALFAARTFPEAAPLFAVLLATTPVLHVAALQPLLEPSLGLFVALAFLGLRARAPWQYAAAGAAALSRPDAIVLVAILAAANALAERRFVQHAALAALAALPCLVWYSLGRSGGGETYLALREAYGSGALPYLAILPKEIFAGWWRNDALALAAFVVAIAAPAAFGAWRAWRAAPRETGAMLAWFAASCAIVVLYGVGKTRYVHPIAFVPLLCFAVGIVELVPHLTARLRRLSGVAFVAATLVAAFAMLWLPRPAMTRLALAESGLSPWPDFAFVALAVFVLAYVASPPWKQRRGAPGTAAVIVLALTAPLVVGGLARKVELLAAVHDFDRAAAAAAEWVRTELPPGERIAALHYSQIKFAGGTARERVVPFRRFEAATLAELRAELAGEGVRYVAWTWRRAPETKAERFYAERRKETLAAPFASGGPVPGFEPVATLPAEPRLHQPPAQIYRIAEE